MSFIRTIFNNTYSVLLGLTGIFMVPPLLIMKKLNILPTMSSNLVILSMVICASSIHYIILITGRNRGIIPDIYITDDGRLICITWSLGYNTGMESLYTMKGVKKYQNYFIEQENTYVLHNQNGPSQIFYNSDGSIEEMHYYINGSLHSINEEPSVIMWNNRKKTCEKWHKNNLLHRIGSPAWIIYEYNGMRTFWYQNGIFYRENNESTYQIYLDDRIHFEGWTIDGITVHNEYGPAFILYNSDGSIKEIRYYLNGLLHRIDGPSIIIWKNNNKIREKWHRNGVLHRDHGPAILAWKKTGLIKFQMYYDNGHRTFID